MNSGWLEPADPAPAEYWLTCRDADAAPGYTHGQPDRRVRMRWNGNGAWVSGYYEGMQRIEPNLVCLHTNNGWRIEGPAETELQELARDIGISRQEIEEARDDLHDLLRRQSPDGCCHKTRIKGWGCPIGWDCPHLKDQPNG